MSPNTATMPDMPPESPCVNICVLDAHGYCIGCYRTIEEIAGWRSYEQRRAVGGATAVRRARCDGAQPNPSDQ